MKALNNNGNINRPSFAPTVLRMVLKKLWSSLKDLLPIILVIAFFQIVVLRQPVQDLMQKAVFSIDGMASVKEAVAMMRTSKVGELIVAKRNQDDAWGIITISDLIKHIVVPGRDPEDVLVYEIMTKPALTISAQMDIRYAIRMMQRIGIHRAPVEHAGEIIGMITLSGLVLNSDLV
jgi:signal-transduction protein with cAMP-binding, CBS, and nucleotidyltransferase domain